MRPACEPDCTIFRPPGMVLQYESACASGEVIASTGSPKFFPPSTEQLTHSWLGPKSW